MVIDEAWKAFPASTGVLEVSHQFPLLGIDADDRQTAALKAVAQIDDVVELGAAVGTAIGSNLLVVHA